MGKTFLETFWVTMVFVAGGLFFRYILEWIDMITNIFSANNSLYVTKIQKKINDIAQEVEESGNKTFAMGFDMSGAELETELEEDDEEEVDDKLNARKTNIIGFR